MSSIESFPGRSVRPHATQQNPTVHKFLPCLLPSIGSEWSLFGGLFNGTALAMHTMFYQPIILLSCARGQKLDARARVRSPGIHFIGASQSPIRCWINQRSISSPPLRKSLCRHHVHRSRIEKGFHSCRSHAFNSLLAFLSPHSPMLSRHKSCPVRSSR